MLLNVLSLKFLQLESTNTKKMLKAWPQKMGIYMLTPDPSFSSNPKKTPTVSICRLRPLDALLYVYNGQNQFLAILGNWLRMASVHYTVHTTHYTLQTTYYILHTTHYTLHTTN